MSTALRDALRSPGPHGAAGPEPQPSLGGRSSRGCFPRGCRGVPFRARVRRLAWECRLSSIVFPVADTDLPRQIFSTSYGKPIQTYRQFFCTYRTCTVLYSLWRARSPGRRRTSSASRKARSGPRGTGHSEARVFIAGDFNS